MVDKILATQRCNDPGCTCAEPPNDDGQSITHCPAHEDAKPSLSVKSGDGGKVLVHCLAGCTQTSVIAALRGKGAWPDNTKGITIKQLAEAKGLDTAVLADLNVRDSHVGTGDDRKPCIHFPYADADGSAGRVRIRYSLDGGSKFEWQRGSAAILPYGLRQLKETADYVILVEGETDTITLLQAGLSVLGIPGAAMWKKDWLKYVGDRDVIIWREPDRGGTSFVDRITRDIPGASVIEAQSQAPGIKDVNALWLAVGQDADKFDSILAGLIENARPAEDITAEARRIAAGERWSVAEELLTDPNLFNRIRAAIVALGYVGDVTAPLLAYMAITSRLTARPLNLAYVAASSLGKSYAVDTAVALMPPSAYHSVGTASPMAIIYDKEEDGQPKDYKHKTVLIAEADSLAKDDGPAGQAMRALANDNCLSYDVTAGGDGGTERYVRHIRHEGPTGVITTSVKRFEDQLDTRFLTVDINDSPEQTRAIINAIAAVFEGRGPPRPDVTVFHAAQEWLALGGTREVLIPYASAISGCLPVEAGRLRRDMTKIGMLISAVAMLHQCQRGRDAEGRIIATEDDYRIARELVITTFTETITSGISKKLRLTVDAVKTLYDELVGTDPDPYSRASVSREAVAAYLKVSPMTISRRVKDAIRLGFLVNDESNYRRPLKLRPGADMPSEETTLPTVEDLRRIKGARIRRAATKVDIAGMLADYAEEKRRHEEDVRLGRANEDDD